MRSGGDEEMRRQNAPLPPCSPAPLLPAPIIGTLSEKSLHAKLKWLFAGDGDLFEHAVGGYVIDVVKVDRLVEIQTGNFGGMKKKLAALLPTHKIELVHPIAQEKWIVRQDENGRFLTRRKSPKRGRWEDVFAEMMRIPHLMLHPNLTVTLLLITEDEVWRNDGRGSWRRKKWSIYDHRLGDVVAERQFCTAADWLAFLPDTLPSPFTNKELQTAVFPKKTKQTRKRAQQMSYTLRHAGLLTVVGKRGNAHLYEQIKKSADHAD